MRAKQLFLTMIGIGFISLIGCSPQTISTNNPEKVFDNYKKDVELKDFEKASKLLNPDDVSSRGKIWAKRWVEINSQNVKSIKLEDLGILGGTAKARVKIIYNDGKTKDSVITLIKNNGTWYISPNFSFGGYRR